VFLYHSIKICVVDAHGHGIISMTTGPPCEDKAVMVPGELDAPAPAGQADAGLANVVTTEASTAMPTVTPSSTDNADQAGAPAVETATGPAIPIVIVRRAQEITLPAISANPIQQLETHLGVMGLGPQLEQARLLALLGMGRYAMSPCSAALISPSGVGKTTLSTLVKSLYPDEDVECLTDLTFASMANGFRWGYTVDREGVRIVDMRRKLLSLDETADSRSCEMKVMGWLRQSTSAEETSRSKAGKDGNVIVRMLGPISVWDCRLDSAVVDYQTANRMIPIRLNDSHDALQAILALTAERPSSAGRKRAEKRRQISRAWRQHIRELDHNLSVQIEFSGQLMFTLPGRRAAAITHGPRILSAVHSVISTVAWLRQRSRPRLLDSDGAGQTIYAYRDDYSIARRILLEGGVLDERPCIPAPSLDLLRRWQALAEAGANQPITAPALYHQARISVDRGNMTRHLSPLLEMELARELPARNSNRQKLFQLTDHGLGASTTGLLNLLPTPESLTMPECVEREEEDA
jgi:hypothetical protein